MAIFKDKIIELNSTETYISNEVIFKGDINLKSSIRIDGTIEGNINEAKVVSIGKNAKIKGNIYCEKCKVEGEVRGNIYALEEIEIFENAILNGDLKTSKLSIESGAVFNGNSIMDFQLKENKKELL